MDILGQEMELRVFINIQKFLAKFCVWGCGMCLRGDLEL